MPRRLREVFRVLDLKSTGKWFILAAATGVVAGFGAVVFQIACQVVLHFGLEGFAGYHPAEPAGEAVWFESAGAALSMVKVIGLMAAGGLVSGWLVYTFAPEAAGHGTDSVIEAYHHKRGAIRPRVPVIKTIASAITIGTGGSGGREGPIAQIGAGFGSFLAERLGLSARDRRILLAAGMGAGIGAIFRAPLAGALFAAEILYRDSEFESEVILPATVASVISYTVYSVSLPAGLMFTPLFGEAHQFHMGSALELLPLAAMAMVLSAVGAFYVKFFYGTHALFERLPGPRMVRPVIGAALAGLVGWGFLALAGGDTRVLAVLGTGYGAIQEALDPALDSGVGLLLLIALGKIITTSFTISSGGSGGVFGPSMVIGGCLGGAVGRTLEQWWPNLVTQPGAYVIVGMTGFFAGCAHAPISTLIMVSEMTGDYKLLVPAMWMSTLCFFFSGPWTIYIQQVPGRIASPAHRGDFLVNVLEGIKVRDVFLRGRELKLFRESETLDTILHYLPHTEQSYFPVVDGDESMVGIFSAKDVRAYMYDEPIWNIAIARDIMTRDVLRVSLEDDLNTALRRFTQRNIDEIPVVDPESPARVLGMLRRKEAIAFYNQRIEELQQD